MGGGSPQRGRPCWVLRQAGQKHRGAEAVGLRDQGRCVATAPAAPRGGSLAPPALRGMGGEDAESLRRATRSTAGACRLLVLLPQGWNSERPGHQHYPQGLLAMPSLRLYLRPLYRIRSL